MTTKQRTDLTNQREVLAASKNEIDAIHNYLKKEPSSIYADIWKIGVNLSLRIGDLLKIKFSDLNITDRTLVLQEEKTGKSKTIRLNNPAIEVINARRSKYPNDVYLFQVNSNRAKNKPISRVAVSVKFFLFFVHECLLGFCECRGAVKYFNSVEALLQNGTVKFC